MPPQEATARPLPKFGEWDVNNPASGEGFTFIFNKARDEKKTSNSAMGAAASSLKDNKNPVYPPNHDAKKDKKPKKLLCCFYGA